MTNRFFQDTGASLVFQHCAITEAALKYLLECPGVQEYQDTIRHMDQVWGLGSCLKGI